MSSSQISPSEIFQTLTQHAMLVVWGLYAQHVGLVEALEQVTLGQRRRTHTPQTKVLEFLVAILAGLPHLQDISRSAHPLDQDAATAEAWGQAAWADYNGPARHAYERPHQSLGYRTPADVYFAVKGDITKSCGLG